MSEGDSAAPLTLQDLAGMSPERLSGVGPKKLKGLATLGIDDLGELLAYYPRRYLDRTKQGRIVELVEGDEALVLGTVGAVDARRVRGGRSLVSAEVHDDTGTIRCTFFNQQWRQHQLEGVRSAGQHVAVFGRVEMFNGRRQMTNPVVDLVGDRTGRVVAIYPLSEKSGVTSWDLNSWVEQTLRRCARRGIADPVPSELLGAHDLVGRAAALEGIHRPSSMGEMVRARTRLVYDELLRLQISLVQRKVDLARSSVGIEHLDIVRSDMVPTFLDGLRFEPTGAQRRVIAEIAGDMAGPAPMHRLLQGDVGSGKTLVSVAALLLAVEGGCQGVMMAPTEVLAEQHATSLRQMLAEVVVPAPETLMGDRPLSVELLTNRTRAAERRRILAGLSDGTVDVVVGTHSLIQDGVDFARLGLAVIDEQHRFGVEQRSALRRTNADGSVPDVMVMTATPIPRTAAMTVYGDLDVSLLDEMPPGRTPITTTWARDELDEAAAWELVRSEVAAGHRAYVVCPLIEDSDKREAASAEQTYEQLLHGELAGLELGLLHGRCSPDEKASVMTRFRSGEVQVLVATTVIEVGVDVPEATVVVVLDADLFGIAQLHQLRGRVGRGDAVSHCVLVATGEMTPDGEARIEALVRTTDGFELAEVDLDLRGEGTVLGDRQKGRNDLRLASLRRDREWVEKARVDAVALVGDGTGMARHPALSDEIAVALADEEPDYLLKS